MKKAYSAPCSQLLALQLPTALAVSGGDKLPVSGDGTITEEADGGWTNEKGSFAGSRLWDE